jgi:hypothetical protein
MVNLDDNLLLNDSRFKEELEQLLDDNVDNPKGPNLPVPDDQIPIDYLDPHPDDIAAGIVHPEMEGDDDEDEEEEEDDKNGNGDQSDDPSNDDPIFQ